MSNLAQKGREAAQLKNQARLEKMSTKPNAPSETGTYYAGEFYPGNYGERYKVSFSDGSFGYGEFITPNAPTGDAKVACYYKGNDKWLFDYL